MDCKYPHRVTLSLTNEAYKKLKTELYLRAKLGDVSKNSMADAILYHMINDIEQGNTSFPIYLDTV